MYNPPTAPRAFSAFVAAENDLDFNASDTHSVNIPAEGIKVSDIFVSTLTNITAVTFFFN